MSVRTFWIGGDEHKSVTYSAETGHNAVEPIGDVHQGANEKRALLDTRKLDEGLSQAVRAAALCNVASCVLTMILHIPLADVSIGSTRTSKVNGSRVAILRRSRCKSLRRNYNLDSPP